MTDVKPDTIITINGCQIRVSASVSLIIMTPAHIIFPNGREIGRPMAVGVGWP